MVVVVVVVIVFYVGHRAADVHSRRRKYGTPRTTYRSPSNRGSGRKAKSPNDRGSTASQAHAFSAAALGAACRGATLADPVRGTFPFDRRTPASAGDFSSRELRKGAPPQRNPRGCRPLGGAYGGPARFRGGHFHGGRVLSHPEAVLVI